MLGHFVRNCPSGGKALLGRAENKVTTENLDAQRKVVTAKAFALTNKDVETATDVITGTI